MTVEFGFLLIWIFAMKKPSHEIAVVGDMKL